MIHLTKATTSDPNDCPIRSVPGVFTPEECDQIIETWGRGGELKPSRTSGGENPIRVSEQVYFDEQWVAERIAGVVRGYALERSIDIWADPEGGLNLEMLSLVRYGPGGKYDWHMDNELTLREDRKIAVVLTLGGEFEGGGTQWAWPTWDSPCSLNPPVGTAALFPSSVLHRGMPVTAGERWILVTWALGPAWR